jgi:hypothetical protein
VGRPGQNSAKRTPERRFGPVDSSGGDARRLTIPRRPGGNGVPVARAEAAPTRGPAGGPVFGPMLSAGISGDVRCDNWREETTEKHDKTGLLMDVTCTGEGNGCRSFLQKTQSEFFPTRPHVLAAPLYAP